MDAEKLALRRRIDTLDQHATRLHAALTEYERENARLKADLEIAKIQNQYISEVASAYEKDIEKLERELEKAVQHLGELRHCGSCIHFGEKSFLNEYYDMPSQCINCMLERSQYVWRGVNEETEEKPMKEEIWLGANGECTKDAIEQMQQELIKMANEAARENGLEEYRLVMDVYKNSYTDGYTIVWRARPFSIEEERRKGSAQLRDMKRACFHYDCYKCKHQKKTEEEMEVCRQAEECEHCRAACACRSCEEGSNWEWEGEEGVPYEAE